MITALELKTFYLVVQGFLGSVGIQYAFANPEQIEGLVILNAPVSTEAKLPWKMKQWGIPFAGDMLTQDPLLVDRTLEGGSGFIINEEFLTVYRKPYLKTSAVGRALLATVQNLQLTQSMAEIEAGFTNWQKPTLVVWGMEDPWLSPTGAEKVVNSCKSAKLIKLPEAKHYPQEHWSTEIVQKITPFFRG